jgi:hypothetical protein
MLSLFLESIYEETFSLFAYVCTLFPPFLLILSKLKSMIGGIRVQALPALICRSIFREDPGMLCRDELRP